MTNTTECVLDMKQSVLGCFLFDKKSRSQKVTLVPAGYKGVKIQIKIHKKNFQCPIVGHYQND